MRMGMVIDLNKCIGCQSCAAACKHHNAQPPNCWWNRVQTIGSKTHQTATGKDTSLRMDFLPLSCQHCENPACEKVCPTGATYVSDEGVVLIDYERCIGCRYCFTACPYGVRQFNWEDPVTLKLDAIENDSNYGYPYDVREGNAAHLVYTQNRPVGVTEKCTFCAQYTSAGLNPACIRACPQKARIYGDLDDPASSITRILAAKQTIKLKKEYGTQPKVSYILSSKVVAI